MSGERMTTEEFAFFESRIMPEPNSGCWLWMGTLTTKQYGSMVRKRDGKWVRAHRWSYEHFKGPIPEGLVIDHLCRVPCCVNPDHLEMVTNKINSLRGVSFVAVNARKTHCKRGHEFTSDNTLVTALGNRNCKICRNHTQKQRPRKPNPRSIRTHCPKGHPYAGDNLIIIKSKTRPGINRQCRACHTEYHRLRWLDKKARQQTGVSL